MMKGSLVFIIKHFKSVHLHKAKLAVVVVEYVFINWAEEGITKINSTQKISEEDLKEQQLDRKNSRKLPKSRFWNDEGRGLSNF